MGHTTDLLGHINIDPALNLAEQSYLAAFSASRRFARPGGPYVVPGNPAAEEQTGHDLATYNSLSDQQPSLWCGWAPCWDGCCLAFDGVEKFDKATTWMQYLIDHFLRPDAHAAGSGLECFDEFTFDHVLNGTIAACRRDTRELYLICVAANHVTEKTIVEPEPQWFDLPDLPYEEQLDRSRPRRRRTAQT